MPVPFCCFKLLIKKQLDLFTDTFWGARTTNYEIKDGEINRHLPLLRHRKADYRCSLAGCQIRNATWNHDWVVWSIFHVLWRRVPEPPSSVTSCMPSPEWHSSWLLVVGYVMCCFEEYRRLAFTRFVEVGRGHWLKYPSGSASLITIGRSNIEVLS